MNLLSRFRSNRRPQTQRRCAIEPLEGRIAPAAITGGGVGGTVTIDLDHVGEALSIHSTGAGTYAITSNFAITSGAIVGPTSFASGTLTMSGALTISFTDSQNDTSITFADSGTNHYTEIVSASLNNAGSSIGFTGTSTLDKNFTASATGDVTSATGSSLVATVGDVTLNAGGDLLLDGAVTGGNGILSQFSLTAAGKIGAVNAGNDFAATVRFDGGSGGVALRDVNGIAFGNSVSDGPLDVTAGGSITQLAGTALDVNNGQNAHFTTTSGHITLTSATNNFQGLVHLRNDGLTAGDDIAITSGTFLEFGAVTIGGGKGVGALTAKARGNIQQFNDPILTGGNVTLNIEGLGIGAPGNILLEAANNIAGSVTIEGVNTGDVQDVALRNVNANAAFPTGTPFTVADDVQDLSVTFDNNAIALPALIINGDLLVTAGGAITQAGALSIGGAGFSGFMTLGNFGIDLTNPANDFTGSVGFDTTSADFTRSVNFNEQGGLLLSSSSLGLAGLSVTSVTGAIFQIGGTIIEQQPGAGPVTLATNAGGTVSLLGSDDNFFWGPVGVTGATHISLRNGNPLATLPTLPVAVTELTLQFPGAAVVLPTLTLIALNVSASGIFQAAGTQLTIGDGVFEAQGGAIALTAAANDFESLLLKSTGSSPVTVVDKDDLGLDPSTLGNGALSIEAGGDITQTGAITQGLNAGLTIFDAGTHNLDLSNPANELTGLLQLTGANVSVADAKTLRLGTSRIANNLLLYSGEDIEQAPGTDVAVLGTSGFTAVNTVNLDHAANAFTGSIAINSFDAQIHNSLATDLAGVLSTGGFELVSGGAITQSGAIAVGFSSFDAGTAGINLGTQANDFGNIGLRSIGTAAVSVKDVNDLDLRGVQLGSGALNLDVAGAITNFAEPITQIGPGAITITNATSVDFSGETHHLLGTITVTNSGDFALDNGADITFSAGSTFLNTAEVHVRSTGEVTLPPTALTLGTLFTTAAKTVVAGDLTANEISFGGAVQFTGAVALNSTAANLTFNGDVFVNGDLNLSVAGGGVVLLPSGTWHQGAHDLAITGGDFVIGDGISPATFAMDSGTITAPGINVSVRAHGHFQVGSTGVADTVLLANPGAGLTFDAGSSLDVGLGTVNDVLVKSSFPGDVVSIDPTARLRSYAGLAGVAASPVLSVGAAQINGRFAGTVAAGNNPHDFLAGSDIVTPSFNASQVLLASGGTVAATGSVTGFESDGDKYTVSAGAAAQLVVITGVDNQLGIVVRNAAAPVKLSIATTKFSGDGFTNVAGIGVTGPGAVTINAPTANLTNEVLVAGPLASLAIHDFDSDEGSIVAGGASTDTTTIQGHRFHNVHITLPSVLGSLTLAQFDDDSAYGTISAERFGKIVITGDTVAGLPGDFHPTRLVNLHATGLTQPGLGSAKIAGTAGGEWDLAGNVGSITNGFSGLWDLGSPGGPGKLNGGQLGDVGSLSLGNAFGFGIFSSGQLKKVTATTWNSSEVTAKAAGSITITGDKKQGVSGNFFSNDLHLTGNAGDSGFTALKSLTVAGIMDSSDVTIDDGNVGSLTASNGFSDDTFTVASTTNGGKVKSIQAGAISSMFFSARSLGSLKVTGNAAVGAPPILVDSDFLLTGTPGTPDVALGSVSVAGIINDVGFTILDGSLGSFKVAKEVDDLDVFLGGAQDGTIGAMVVGDWVGGSLTALSIKNLTVTTVPVPLSGGPAFAGDLSEVNVNVFQTGGTKPALGALKVAGGISLDTDGFITVPGGIGSFAVARDVEGDGDSLIAVGAVGSMTVGNWDGQDLVADSLGKVKITGYTDPTNPFVSKVFGEIFGSDWLVGSASAAKGPGLGSLSIQEDFQNSTLVTPAGIGSLLVGGEVQDSRITADNPVTPALGHVGLLQAGQIADSVIHIGLLDNLKTVANSALGVNGTFRSTSFAVTHTTGPATAPVGLGSVSIAGNMESADFLVPGGIKKFTVTGSIFDAHIAAATLANAHLGSLTVASFEDRSELVARNIDSFKVVGAPGVAANVTDSLISIQGDSAGNALGTFSAGGVVSNTTFNVTGGNVGSFTVGKFISSNLYVGAHQGKDIQLDATADWLGDFSLGSFKTTQPAGSTSFIDSNIIAAALGKIAIGTIDPLVASELPLSYGIAFRTSATTPGTVTIEGVAQAVGTANGKFLYAGLAG